MPNKQVRYCIVCEREYGSGLDQHCTENSMVIIEKGDGKKGSIYFALDGTKLSDEEFEAKKSKEIAIFRQLEDQKKSGPPEINQSNSELANVLIKLKSQDVGNSQAIICRQCGSTQLNVYQKGYGLKNAAIGAVLLGPVGLLGGFLGSKDIFITCLNCGYKWEPGK